MERNENELKKILTDSFSCHFDNFYKIFKKIFKESEKNNLINYYFSFQNI